VATSAYQIEGASENDWTEWERLGRLKDPRVRCGKAAGHRERWRSDLALLPTIGANAYRFSVEWSRIEPRRGRFDEAGLLEAREAVEFLTRLGVEPVVTLHHYTHPRWFWAGGGWENRESIEWFRRFAATIADAVGDRVRLWVTLNEPIVLLLAGYLGGLIPPGQRSFRAASVALEHMLHAHVEAAQILKGRNPSSRVGIAHNMLDFAPDRPGNALDRRLARAGERLYNLALLEAIATGNMDWAFPGEGRATSCVPGLPAANDYVGVNYYSRVHLRFSRPAGLPGRYFYRDPEKRGLTETGWEIHPPGFERVLRAAAEAGRPLVVTENGIAARDDGIRRDFLREHALILAHVRQAGLPVEGYFYWSLLDNFEWLEGFRPRFGLFEVDYATFARRRRPSAALFAELGKRFTAVATGERSSGAVRK
jgi:beta-glucosidase